VRREWLYLRDSVLYCTGNEQHVALSWREKTEIWHAQTGRQCLSVLFNVLIGQRIHSRKATCGTPCNGPSREPNKLGAPPGVIALPEEGKIILAGIELSVGKY
jgi:hypothetical protein